MYENPWNDHLSTNFSLRLYCKDEGISMYSILTSPKNKGLRNRLNTIIKSLQHTHS